MGQDATNDLVSSLQRVDDHEIADDPSEVRVFVVARNESLRLPYFFEYYRKLGASRFFVVDNGSEDDTQAILSRHADVHAFWTEESYQKSRAGTNWVNYLLDRFGAGHWCITVDADELLVYPHSEQMTLHEFCSFLDDNQEEALYCVMLDMYSDKPISETVYVSGRPFLEAASYFDKAPYYAMPIKNFPFVQIRGGVRRRVFWAGTAHNEGPALNKVPLVKWRQGLAYTGSTHTMSPSAILSQVTGALLHFKYFADFGQTARREHQRKDRPHINEYQAYAEGLEANPRLTFYTSDSVKFCNSDQLVRLGLVRSTRAWSDHARRVAATSDTPFPSQDEIRVMYSSAVQRHRVPARRALDLLGLFFRPTL